MSSQVTQHDPRFSSRRNNESTGEAESLAGKIKKGQMGSRAVRTAIEEKEKKNKKKLEKEAKLKQSGAERKSNKQKGSSIFHKGYGFNNILQATDDFESLQYRPKTKETKEIYELILAFIQKVIGDSTQEVLRGVVDEVLSILKNENLKDFDKKKEIEVFTEPLGSEQFASLVNLGKKITDFKNEDVNDLDIDDGSKRILEDTIEDGVAVEFDEEEEYSEEDIIKEDEEEDVDTMGGIVVEGEDTEITSESMDVDVDEVVVSAAGDAVKDVSLNPHDIDAFWLQRTISRFYPDAQTAQTKTLLALNILSSSSQQVENKLVEEVTEFESDKFNLVKLLTRNREIIVWCTKLAKAGSVGEDVEKVKKEMQEKGLGHILEQLNVAPTRQVEGGGRSGRRGVVENAMELDEASNVQPSSNQPSDVSSFAPKSNIDLEELAFTQGGHLNTNKNCKLPQGSFIKSKKGYKEVHVPPPASNATKSKLIAISSLPEWAQTAFSGATSLNRVQSQVYPVAFNEDKNMLLCAPTGAGKTNCAMLTILRVIGQFTNQNTGLVDLDNFKIVYIAPMKALVAEMVQNFSKRLKDYGVTVAELSGDKQLTKAQIAETQVIVATPEKWDIITRKATDRSYTNLVRLIIIDEIHLLHDDRGPVLESIVTRTLRNVEQTQQPVRLVGLSATLPNSEDVAKFLRCPEGCLFVFDNSFRPCPLKQQYIGITEKKAIKRFQLMNDITYEKVMEEAGKNQMLIFVHSRKETAKSAKTIRDMALENESISQILRQESESYEILKLAATIVENPDLQNLLPYGFGIHHAGLTRSDKNTVEKLFAEGHIQVLCSTATLAWGVNLPAHTVIIRGTQVYSPEKGKWVELSPQDVLQMLGRAGRPQFDTHGEGIIITTHQELQYYLCLLNIQLPIESQFISKLSDNLNAEIVLGSIRNRDEAVQWLGYTYLYVRMRKNPALYGISVSERNEDPHLKQKRVDLIHAAALILDKCHMIKYDRKTGKFQGTELGRIASHYYISHKSMATYNMHLKPTMSQIDLFRVFALSDEFKFIPVRDEEKLELIKMVERVPIPIKEAIDEPTAKINVLLQSYISQLKLEGFALMADMVYVTQSAGRILRAIFEISLRRGWAQLTRKTLSLCQMVDKRMWLSMNPLRQFKNTPAHVIKKLEAREQSWESYKYLTPQVLGEYSGDRQLGNSIHRLIHQFPRLEVNARVSPITRSLLKVDLILKPDFVYDERVSGASEAFWVLVEDCDSELILHQDSFVLKKKYATEDHYLGFTVELFDPLPPNYFVSVISDRWLHCETRLPISFKHLILPEKYPPHTELLDMVQKTVSELKNKEFESVFKKHGITAFNPIQSQVFQALYLGDNNVFIGAPAGCGKTVCAELALMRLWSISPKARCVYIAPYDEVVNRKLAEWTDRFKDLLGGKNIVSLTGESTTDLKLLATGDVIFTTPQKWDVLSRRWKQRKDIQTIGLCIADEIHLIGDEIGPTYEIIVSRMIYMAKQTENKIRMVALGTSLANAKDVGHWIHAASSEIFNFHPSVRPVPLEIHIQGYNIPHFPSMMLAMNKPAYFALTQLADNKSSIVFVPSRKHCRLTAVELLTFCAADGDAKKFLKYPEGLTSLINFVQDKALSQMLEHGLAFYHEALSKSDRRIVEKLFTTGVIQVVIASKETCWSLPLKANLVVLMGAQYYEGKEHRYKDYQMTDVLQMMGLACKPIGGEAGKCVLMCQTVKKDFYKKFLYEALPVESHLDQSLHDHFNAEIVTKTIENMEEAVDYLTWTFYYRRLQLSDHLSELVENTLESLAKSKCISLDEHEVSPLNLGMIAAYYNINYVTMECFATSLGPKTKLRNILDIISHAAEFLDIPIRHHEDTILQKIYERLPYKVGEPKFNDPHLKTNILLQAHFSRVQLPSDLEADQKSILEKIVQLIQAAVDVISSNGWLAPALSAMELCQMTVQAMWDKDSPLRQIPHLGQTIIEVLKKKKVETVFELMEMEDDDRSEALSLSTKEMADVANFCNRYPNIEISYDLPENTVEQGGQVVVKVQLEREEEEEEENDKKLGSVIAPFYPKTKDEGWWIVIGDVKEKTLLAIKRTTLQKKAQLTLKFSPPEKIGKVDLIMYVMCDSYSGVDQEFNLDLTVLEGVSEGEEDSGDSEMNE
ncbi:DEIH-box ATPase [Clydaea vesicula]|uniref:DEIH-box ATPase n=1 Tax=Clydaea vesicula TaxID=447962 RepID=A0AAD5XXU6_9FUNG|nr:DEIH-box ATPase [Clydaea vesicula]